MLPSKGYFRSIDCPFYKNNLCHRFYCHFRHNKKESFVSSRLELTDIVNNEDNSEIFQNVHEAMKNGSHEDSDKHSLEVVHSTINDENGASHVNVETNDEKAYLLLTDIPKYNPTPISELKTWYKQASKTDDHLDKAGELKFNQINKIETCKDSNIIETLVDYFMKSDSIKEDVDIKNVEISIDSDLKNNVIKKPDNSQFTAADSTTVQKGIEEIFPTQNLDLVVQENIKLKEMINQLTVIDNCKGPNNEKKVLDNETLLEDLMGTGINSVDKNDFEKIKITKTDHINTEDCGKTFKKHQLKNSDRAISKQHKRHTRSIKHANLITGSKNQRCTLNNKKESKYNKKSNHTKNENKKVKNIYTSVDKSDTKDKTQNAICDIEVILISDSEDVGELTISDISTTGESDKVNEKLFEDSLPEPKRKVRVSHVLSQNSSSHQIGYSCQEKSYAKFKTSSIENDYQLSKQKERLAHTLNYKTLSVQTVQDHLSHWESVKERVKNKCTNPGGEAGYQNWSRVKISPVPNVASLMNSKKMLYSRIHQWKSKTSI